MSNKLKGLYIVISFFLVVVLAFGIYHAISAVNAEELPKNDEIVDVVPDVPEVPPQDQEQVQPTEYSPDGYWLMADGNSGMVFGIDGTVVNLYPIEYNGQAVIMLPNENESVINVLDFNEVDGVMTPTFDVADYNGLVIYNKTTDELIFADFSTQRCEVAFHDHDYIESVVYEATCQSSGHTRFECQLCGDYYVGNLINPLGHDYVDGICQRCGEAEVVFCDHYFEQAFYQEPSCTEGGYAEDVCSYCNQTLTYSLEALGHDYVDGTCSRCGDVVEHVHTYEITGTTPACLYDGTITYTCSGCGDIYTEVVPGIGKHAWDYSSDSCSICGVICNHSFIEDVRQYATCTEGGLVNELCRNCGRCDSYPLLALGHDYVDGTCSRCGDVVSCQHDYIINVIEPECEAPGLTSYICSKCAHTYEDFFVEATGHGELVNLIIPASHTFDGVSNAVCSDCLEVMSTTTLNKLSGTHDMQLVSEREFSDYASSGDNYARVYLNEDLSIASVDTWNGGIELDTGTNSFDGTAYTAKNFVKSSNVGNLKMTIKVYACSNVEDYSTWMTSADNGLVPVCQVLETNANCSVALEHCELIVVVSFS